MPLADRPPLRCGLSAVQSFQAHRTITSLSISNVRPADRPLPRAGPSAGQNFAHERNIKVSGPTTKELEDRPPKGAGPSAPSQPGAHPCQITPTRSKKGANSTDAHGVSGSGLSAPSPGRTVRPTLDSAQQKHHVSVNFKLLYGGPSALQGRTVRPEPVSSPLKF